MMLYYHRFTHNDVYSDQVICYKRSRSSNQGFDPHPNSNYQPLTTKAFMQIGVIANGVARRVMNKIFLIMLRSFG